MGLRDIVAVAGGAVTGIVIWVVVLKGGSEGSVPNLGRVMDIILRKPDKIESM